MVSAKCVLVIISDCHGNVQSSQKGGTLSQLHNLINRRNVLTKVARDYHAVSGFVDLVADCHVLDTAMKHLGMMTVDNRLSRLPRLLHLWSADKKEISSANCWNHHQSFALLFIFKITGLDS